MYSARFLAVQIVLLLAVTSHAAFHSVRMEGRGSSGEGTLTAAITKPAEGQKPVAKSFGLVGEKELRAYVAQNVTNIKRVSSSPKFSTQQKLDFIKSTVQAVANYRAKNWSKSAFAEMEMDLSIKPFESFPDAKDFKAQRCNQYQHHLILEWEPGAQDLRPSARGVSEALNVLRQICKS